jgi:hypothetical protein
VRIRLRRIAILVGALAATHTFAVSTALGATGLPFSSSFETGDFSEWNGGLQASLSVTSADATDGRYAAQAVMAQGQPTDNYKDYIFGDHVRVGGDPVTPAQGLWLQFDSKFDAGFSFGSNSTFHKIAIVNFEDENSRRRFQVVLNVRARSGDYYIERLRWNADRSFNKAVGGLSQNVGAPVLARLGQWDRLVLFIKPNTPGNLDGAIRFWVNGELKGEYLNITLREETQYNPNKLILSNYAPDTTTVGVQRWDNFYLGLTDPRIATRPMPPQNVEAD